MYRRMGVPMGTRSSLPPVVDRLTTRLGHALLALALAVLGSAAVLLSWQKCGIGSGLLFNSLIFILFYGPILAAAEFCVLTISATTLGRSRQFGLVLGLAFGLIICAAFCIQLANPLTVCPLSR